jgi:hypothetical protein
MNTQTTKKKFTIKYKGEGVFELFNEKSEIIAVGSGKGATVQLSKVAFHENGADEVSHEYDLKLAESY